MRLLAPALLLVLALPGYAEDLEAFTLRDGRTFVGRYEEAERKLYLREAKGGKIRMAISVSPGEIAERRPWSDPAEQAARVVAEEDAKRAAAAAEAKRAAAASAAVSDTVAAQEQRRREQVEQATERAQRAEAETRAAYWQAEGRWNFNPVTMTAAQMDEHVRRTRAMLAERQVKEDRNTEEEKSRTKSEDDLRSFAKDFRLSVIQAGDDGDPGMGIPTQIRAAVRWLASSTHCFRPWKVDARQIRDARSFDEHEVAGNNLFFIKRLYGFAVSARYSHRVIAAHLSDDPWTKADLMSVSIALAMPASEKNIAMIAGMFAKGARISDPLVSAYANDFDKTGFFVQVPEYPQIVPVSDGAPAMIKAVGLSNDVVRATISGKPGEYLLRWIKPDLTTEQIKSILSDD